MKNIFFYLLLISFLCLSINAKADINPVFYSTKVGEGLYSVARGVDLSMLNGDDYLHNAFYLKTKGNLRLDKSKLRILNNPEINAILDKINITEIRKPFEQYLNQHLLSGSNSYGIERLLLVSYDSQEDLRLIIDELSKIEDVEYATPIYRRFLTAQEPNDPEYHRQNYLNIINAGKAWEVTVGSQNVIIAFIDSGIDYTHEDLEDNIWINPNEIENNGHDDDGNGFIDDVRGWDFVGDITAEEAFSKQWKSNNDPRPNHPSNDHGTHVAGLSSAVTNNGIGIASLGQNLKILPIKCTPDNINTSQGGSREIYRTEEAIMYAAAIGADVINCSFAGRNFSPAEQDVINAATAMGSLVVAAAGNDGTDYDEIARFPAYYDNVLAVGGLNSAGEVKSGSSSYGSRIDVYAPSVSLLSTVPDNKYVSKTGTSMSAPLVSALAGLIKSVRPELQPEQISKIIRLNSRDALQYSTDERYKQYGIIDAGKSLNNLDVPSVVVTQVMMVSQGGYFDKIGEFPITIEIRNIRDAVSDLQISIEPIDYFLDINENSFDFTLFEQNEMAHLNIRAKLSDLTPWFYGVTSFLITIKAGEYIDYELVQIPINMKTPNIFRSVREFAESMDFTKFYPAINPTTPDNLWIAGDFQGRPYYYRYDQAEYSDRIYNNNYKSAGIWASSQSEAYSHIIDIDDNFLIFKTTNWGNDWQQLNIETTKNFVAVDIKDRFKISALRKTADSYQFIHSDNSLNTYNSKEIPIEIGNPIDGTFQVNEEFVSFATDNSEFVFSSNFGDSWEVNDLPENHYILRIRFDNVPEGMAIVQNTATDRYYAYSTDDIGSSWKQVFDFTSYKLQPIELAVTPNSRQYIFICKGGELITTIDYGENWRAEQNYKYKKYDAVKLYHYDNYRSRIWAMQDDLTYLQFFHEKYEDKQELFITPSDTLRIDSVEINSTYTAKVTLNNTGDTPIVIDDISFFEQSTNPQLMAFSLEYQLLDFMYLDYIETINLIFKPTIAGDYYGALTIKPRYMEPHRVIIHATSVNPVSVIESSAPLLYIYPNPTRDILHIRTAELISRAELSDLLGNVVIGDLTPTLSKGDGVSINVENLPAGMYFLKLYTASGEVLVEKVIVGF